MAGGAVTARARYDAGDHWQDWFCGPPAYAGQGFRVIDERSAVDLADGRPVRQILAAELLGPEHDAPGAAAGSAAAPGVTGEAAATWT